MKKFILAAFVAALSLSPVLAQKQVKQDAKGNFYEVRDSVAVLTTKTFKDSKGRIYGVWRSPRGKLFVNVISKAGKTYKKYLN